MVLAAERLAVLDEAGRDGLVVLELEALLPAEEARPVDERFGLVVGEEQIARLAAAAAVRLDRQRADSRRPERLELERAAGARHIAVESRVLGRGMLELGLPA